MRKFFSLWLLCCCMGSLVAQPAIRKGVVQIKLNAVAEQRLRQAIRPYSAAGGVVQTGLTHIDEVNVRYKARKMEPVFTVGGPFEERQRRAGLHLWYEIAINETEDETTAVDDYLKTGEVAIASPVYAIQAINAEPITPTAASSNDPLVGLQWHYNNTGQTSGGVPGMDIRLLDAWALTTGDPKVIVAVMDGGIDYNHPDLKNNMWSGIGKSFIVNSGGVIHPQDHGTHVAGIIAASSNNNVGVAGIAGGWGVTKGVQLMSCQVIEPGKNANTADAFVYAADNGAVISQNSWGYGRPGVYDPATRTAIKYFIEHAGKDNAGNPLPGTPMAGGIVIFAAGNDTSDRTDWYPGMYPEVVTVAAIGPTGRRPIYSNYGAAIDIAAPGGDMDISMQSGVFSTILNANKYTFMHGTSMACPHVSGVAALVLSRLGSETYTPELLRERLLLSARPIPTEPLYAAKKMGAGLIDASRAVLDYEAVTGVHLDPSVDTVYANRTIKLNATVEPPTAANNHVTWQTADPGIATVDEMGVVTGKAAGTVTISVLTVQGSFTASAAITVIPVLAEGISVAFQQATIKKGESLVLIADITPADATNKAVEWYSKNTSIATINNTGVVVGINVGDTYIVAVSDDGGFKDSCLVSVVQTVQDVELITPQTVRLALGDTTTIKARVLPPDAYDQQIYFMSSNSGIVSIDANTGKTQAKKTGIATITVRTNDGNFITTCEVTVYDGAHAPEGFSPNNDGHNDYFEFILDSRESYTLHVFDRSGQVHYKSDEYKNDWDGTANTGPQSGKKVRAGTYYYRLAGKLLGKVKTGYVVVKY